MFVAENLVGAQVEVCLGDDCRACGTPIPKASLGGWSSRFCGGRDLADNVRIMQGNGELVVCKINIVGGGLYSYTTIE